jgi:hypothetical protein
MALGSLTRSGIVRRGLYDMPRVSVAYTEARKPTNAPAPLTAVPTSMPSAKLMGSAWAASGSSMVREMAIPVAASSPAPLRFD